MLQKDQKGRNFIEFYKKPRPTGEGKTADLSTALRSGRDDKGECGCGPDLMFTEGLHLGDEKRLLFSSYCPWKYRPPLCHLDRSSEGA
jgi:hypothetical protein